MDRTTQSYFEDLHAEVKGSAILCSLAISDPEKRMMKDFPAV